MHEIGVLYKVAKYAEELAVKNGLEKIDEIILEVGELTGILPIFLEKYYPVVAMNNCILCNSKLRLQIVSGEAICNECETFYNVLKNEGLCPRCQSTSKTILGGKDFKIIELVVYNAQ